MGALHARPELDIANPPKVPTRQEDHPQTRHQIAKRNRRGSVGGRPLALGPTTYRRRAVIERSFNDDGQRRGLPMGTGSLPYTTRRHAARDHHLAARIERHSPVPTDLTCNIRRTASEAA